MKTYEKVGEIAAFESIPWGKHVIVTGSIGGSRAWFHRLPGVFLNDNNNIRFISDYGTVTCFSKGDPISINLLGEAGEGEKE